MKSIFILSLLLVSFISNSQDTSRGIKYYEHGKKKSIWIDNNGIKHNGQLSCLEYSMGHAFFYPNDSSRNVRLTPQNTKYFLYDIDDYKNPWGTH